MFAAVFPGQGSQKPGMGHSLYENFDAAKQVFDEVSGALQIDVAKLCFESSEDELRQTQNAQIALYTCGLAAYRALAMEGYADALAGHSVGEYAAVVASGALTVREGARLVWRRGELMKNAPSGTMAAVLGLDALILEDVCRRVDGEVVIANDNCPGQLVISGSHEAVAAASEKASAAGAKRVLPLNVSGAFHSPLMVDAAREMGAALNDAAWQPQAKPVYANVTAGAVEGSASWAGLLERQLSSSVRWTETIQAMIANGITTFVEFGSGEVLTGLLKRIDKEATGLAVTDASTVNEAKLQLGGVNA
ncbi:MAG: ACP S-malonyltransferase [Chthonomonas sp.]|nr:ACP S-malonyltransferase [Chthonomonas sp.]